MNISEEEQCFYAQPEFLVERFWLVTVSGTTIASISIIENLFLFLVLVTKFFYMIPMITVSHIAMTSSSFLILSASFERFCITVMPHRMKCLNRYRGQIATAAVILGIVTKSTLAFEFSIKYHEECVDTMAEYALELSALATDPTYNLLWRLWFRNVVTILLPFFLLAFMNARTAITLHTSQFILQDMQKLSEAQRKSRVRAATRSLLFVVFTYLLSNILNVIVTIWEYIDIESLQTRFIAFYIYSVDVVSLLTVLAGALRLPIYVSCQPQLRAEFVLAFRRLFGYSDIFTKRLLGLGEISMFKLDRCEEAEKDTNDSPIAPLILVFNNCDVPTHRESSDDIFL
ncbi:hypothetical protein Tcan_08480 [Toxocara canis]|uniref:G-protein coupled receptors family 1 profile domain-containing protein n=1 Tax=Toxocara canis TaxID=6265 RepID=A0A0B2VW33_TOXCA|nr:hypothetical protein Tcan_08480 [Toxocara canis]